MLHDFGGRADFLKILAPNSSRFRLLSGEPLSPTHPFVFVARFSKPGGAFRPVWKTGLQDSFSLLPQNPKGPRHAPSPLAEVVETPLVSVSIRRASPSPAGAIALPIRGCREGLFSSVRGVLGKPHAAGGHHLGRRRRRHSLERPAELVHRRFTIHRLSTANSFTLAGGELSVATTVQPNNTFTIGRHGQPCDSVRPI